jgi:catechol 2,3-dioxygenase-like lactoylglutathione lyase family enzyme
MPSSTANEKHTSVRGLGEIALRVNNLEAMQKFYEQVIGLPLMTRVPNCAFFKIADGYGGHTQVPPCSTALRAPVIEKRTPLLPPSTTSHSRYRSLISQPKRRDWSRWGFKPRPLSTHGCTGALSM